MKIKELYNYCLSFLVKAPAKAPLPIPEDVHYKFDSDEYILKYRGIQTRMTSEMVREIWELGVDPFQSMKDVLDDVILEDEISSVETKEES